jgi:hypothetical protein
MRDEQADAGARPWAQPRWFERAERWLRASSASLGYQPTGPVDRVQVWELSCVLRLPTARGDVYFKATADSPLFVNEGVVMGVLAGLFGDRVPRPLAVDAERRWMLLADVGEQLGGDEHGAGVPVEVGEDVLRAFARLQVDAVRHADRLLAAGFADRRLPRLAGEAARWLPEIEATGRLPGIDAATWLSAEEMAALRAAVPRLAACCGALAAYAVPPSLVHGDLHLSNVARGPRGYRFFDWSDTCVAHPFADAIIVLEEEDGARRDRLRDAYLSGWTAFEPAERLLRAWRLAEPLVALHQAVSYRSIVANLGPPIDRHMMQSTAWWLRKVLAAPALPA